MQRLKSSQDLDLRLGFPLLQQQDINMLCRRNVIVINDDEDGDEESEVEVVVYSPNSSSSEGTAARLPVISEEDLELRLGNSKGNGASCLRNHDRRGETLPTCTCMKTKHGLASSSGLRPGEGLKFICTICLDTMKELTSTTCGHVFCNSCITNAINVQSRCPTCREVLSKANIHRIYLPGVRS